MKDQYIVGRSSFNGWLQKYRPEPLDYTWGEKELAQIFTYTEAEKISREIPNSFILQVGEPLTPWPELKNSTREQILKTAIEIVTKDRNTTYGAPEDSFKIIADFWKIYLTSIDYRNLNGKDVAVMMALLKIARIASSPKHKDHWIDLAGYAACGGEIANLQTEQK